jgi:DNA-directed RNA polymerase specialized sigma54-like protein
MQPRSPTREEYLAAIQIVQLYHPELEDFVDAALSNPDLLNEIEEEVERMQQADKN